MADLWDNPAGTEGFEFIEYAAPDPRAMGELFERLGFKPIARHRHKNEITQGGRNPVALASGETRAFLEDGDEVILRGRCEKDTAAYRSGLARRRVR
jgi:4-hydroxyphenylpyruvate dioxygenase-like putative hemolysin